MRANCVRPLFEILAKDRIFYEESLRDFLPDRLIDIHAHVWLEQFKAKTPQAPLHTATWPAHAIKDNSIEDLLETYRLLFPGKTVTPLIFGKVFSPSDDVEAGKGDVSRCGAA